MYSEYEKNILLQLFKGNVKSILLFGKNMPPKIPINYKRLSIEKSPGNNSQHKMFTFKISTVQ